MVEIVDVAILLGIEFLVEELEVLDFGGVGLVEEVLRKGLFTCSARRLAKSLESLMW